MKRLVAIFLVTFSCTDVYLKEPPPPPEVTAPTTASVSGSFCTDDPKTLVTPVKILFALDYSQSMIVSDPGTTRGEAVVKVMERLGQDDALSYAVVLFRGDVNVLTKRDENGQRRDGFQPSRELDPADMRARLNVGLPSPETVDQQTTDFVGALSRVRALLEDDVLRGQADPDQLARTRYIVVFLSDGIPSRNYPQGCQPGGTGASACPVCVESIASEVRKIERIVDQGVGEVVVNTAYVFNNPDVPPPPANVQRAASGLLSCMATEGAGDFRDFSLGEPVDFLGFDYDTLQRLFLPKLLLVSNAQARPGTFAPDTDGDGLSDAAEALLKTDPLKADTDGDGYGDLLESRFSTDFKPIEADPGCPAVEQGDRDGDGLRDCEERFVGTALGRFDSDRDGVGDGLEWRLGTRPSSADLDDDEDHDGLANRDELRAHTDPGTPDVANLSDAAQRVTLRSQGSPRDGRSCFDFRVDNVHLVETLDDRPNELVVSLSQVPLDAPGADPLSRVAVLHALLQGGVRSPSSGEVVLTEGSLAAPVPVPAPPELP